MTDLIRTLPLSVERSEYRAASHTPRVALAVKRTLDVALAFAGLVTTLPLLLLLGVLVKLDSHGPALFRQTRVGASGRRFKIAKFRTMVDGAEAVLARHPTLLQLHKDSNFKLPVDADPRVTKVGRFLRRTSLDELPQLWNVLRGDMSLVGARPIEPAQVPVLYGARQAVYLRMRPGLTGLWQVSGRSHIGDDDRAELDISYIREWSLWLDARILFKTLPTVLTRHGAH